MEYIIRNNKRIKVFTKYIIITHSRNLLEDGKFIKPEAVAHNSFFTAGVMEEYFMKTLKKYSMPYHYYVDSIGDDWFIFKELREYNPSYYIEDLVSAGVIEAKYLNSILVCISEDFSRYTIDRRMSEQLVSKLITDLIRKYNDLDITKVKYIDDCLTDNWKDNLSKSTLKYQYKEGIYYDRDLIRMDYNKFHLN